MSALGTSAHESNVSPLRMAGIPVRNYRIWYSFSKNSTRRDREIFIDVSTDAVSDPGDWESCEDDKSRFIFSWETGHFESLDISPLAYPVLHGEARTFLGNVYAHAEREDIDGAIDLIFENINELLLEGKFGACDRILDETDVEGLPPVLLVSFLTITAAAESKLKSRKGFFDRVYQAVVRRRGEKAAQSLLDGLG